MSIQNNKPRALALGILNSIFNDGAYGNIALAKTLGSVSLSDTDRRFLTELVYGTVKAKGTLDWYINKSINKPMHKLDKRVLNVLRLAVYQIFYLDKVPASAACNEAVELVKSFGHEGMVKFVNGVLRGIIRNQANLVFPTMEENAPLHVALTYCHPEWLVQRWRYRYSMEDAIAICAYDNEQPHLTLRVNTTQISREDLAAKLTAAGLEVEASKWSKDGLIGKKLGSVGELMRVFGAYIYVQDESSMLVADILAPKPGELLIDVCSAPGGKTTHLAQKMQNKGRVIATDIHEHKLKLIEANAQRLGLTNIVTQLQDATKQVAAWVGKADRVLVDAPCSGLGVLGRRPEARWNKVEKELSQFPPLQGKILANAATYVKPGGRLVYSTCTLEQNENVRVVDAFLKEHKEFHRVEFKHPLTGESLKELQLLPQKDGIDGFYICLLERSKS